MIGHVIHFDIGKYRLFRNRAHLSNKGLISKRLDIVNNKFSFGVSGNQLGVALGFIIPSLIIAGPVNSFRGISNEEDETFGGSFPNDWRNETHWNVTEAATNEVTTQIRLLFFPFAGICVMLFFVILFLFQDKPPKPANRAQMER